MRGGLVYDVISGMHFNVIVVDFAGMYPSIIIALNLSKETKHPDGDIVEFSAVFTRPFGGPGADPYVKISSDGTFYIDVWDPDIGGYFGYYEITISDGELSRTTDFEIVVNFY